MDAISCNAESADRQLRQPYSTRLEDPLRGAVIANAQLKLHLRRLRAAAPGSHRRAAITRLLNVGESVDRSISWLQDAPDEPRFASVADLRGKLGPMTTATPLFGEGGAL